MSENALHSSRSSQAETSGLGLHTEGSPKTLSPSIRSEEAVINVLNIQEEIAGKLAPEKATKKSPRKQLELSKIGNKQPPRKTIKSLTTVAKKDSSKNETKQEIKPSKGRVSNRDPKSPRMRTSSPGTSTKNETPNKVKKSPRRGKSPPKTPVVKRGSDRDQSPNKKKLPVTAGESPRSQSISRPISREKSVKSVISKDSSRQSSMRSTIRDSIFRNYPFDSPLVRTSLTPDVSIVSVLPASSRMSTISGGPKKSQKKPTPSRNIFWGPYHVRMLKTQPKEQEPAKQVQATSEDSSETSESEEIDITPLIVYDAEEKVRRPVSEHEAPVEESSEDKQAERDNFLQIFDGMPDFNELSDRESVEVMELPPEAERTPGNFVPPVDRDSSESDRSETSSRVDEEMIFTRSVGSKSTLSSGISLDSFTESDEKPDKDLTVTEESCVDDIFACMMSVKPRKMRMEVDTFSTSSGDELGLATIKEIELFLVGIINQAVVYAENASIRWKRHLDPAKMVKELTQLCVNYQDELQWNLTLDKVVSEYFIRKREFGLVCKTNEVDEINRSRLRTALVQLDGNLEREKETQRISHNLVDELTKQEKSARNLDVENVQKFEAKVRETLFKDGYDHLKHVTNDLLRKMNKVRDELSNQRQELTTVQHQLASIKNKSEEMEDLGNGLRVREYMSYQEMNHSISVKINERNVELQRLNDRINYDIHAMAHLKDKRTMNQDLLRELKTKLKSKQQRKKDLRDLYHAGMLRRKHLKKQMQDIRTNGCLLHYPDMMRDYDATEELLQAKRQVILQLRAEYSRVDRRVSQVESGIASICLANKSTSNFNASSFGLSSK